MKALIPSGSSQSPTSVIEVRGVRIDRTVPTITFVNRNLERLSGFDLFSFITQLGIMQVVS